MFDEATAMCRQYRMELEEVRMEAELLRCKSLLLEQHELSVEEREAQAELKKQANERSEMKTILQQQMRQQEAQAAMEQQMEAVRAHHEEVAAARHEESVMRNRRVEAWALEEQQAQQKEEYEAQRLERAGQKRKYESELAELRPQSTEERQGQVVSSPEDQAASSFQEYRNSQVPVLSVELQAWLARHELLGVHGRDRNDWSALHHVAMDSKIDIAAAGILEELCRHQWSPQLLNAVTGAAPESEHLPKEWTALHILANCSGTQRGRLAQRILSLRADPMPLTARGATPLHRAAATGNIEVA